MSEDLEREIKMWESKMRAAAKQLSFSPKAEGPYVAAYHKLVQLGARPRLRKKYRG